MYLNILLIILFIIVVIFFMSIRIVQQYQQAVILRLGRYIRSLEPSFHLVIPLIDSVGNIDMRVRVENQDIITKDSVPVTLNAVVYYQVVNAQKALLDVEDYRKATGTLAQTILGSNLGAHTMQEMLTEQKRV
jgi:regulator of protease activity HflC (stomatin/prohibitin superfamily)